MVQEHLGEYPSLWAAIESIAPKIDAPQTLHDWVKRDQIDKGQREGLTSTGTSTGSSAWPKPASSRRWAMPATGAN